MILKKPISKKTLQMMIYKSDFIAFVSIAFRILHPRGTLKTNWHIDIIADALHDCLLGNNNRLIIHAPPRSLKSFITSIAFPAFALGRDPTLKIMSIVATRELAADFCHKLARLLSSDVYRNLFPNITFVRKRESILLDNGGSFISSPFFSSVVGRGADMLIVDDPVAPVDAKNDHFNEKAAELFKAEILPRLNDKASSIAVLVMQRLAKKDLSTVFFASERPKTLSFPAVSRREEQWILPDKSIFVRPARTVLNPKTETLEELWKLFQSMGFRDFARQYLQDVNAEFYISGPIYYEFDTTDWNPEKGYPKSKSMFSNAWYLRYECFGIGEPPPYLSKNPLTEEQDSEYIAWSQAKLFREMQNDVED